MGRRMKHTEIGDIPADWKLQTFEETFRVLSNNTLSRENLNNKGGAVRNIHYGDILTKFPEVLNCNEEDIPYLNDLSLITANTQLLQDGDIVIADTAEDETVGKTIEVQDLGDGKLVAGLHTIPCRVKKGDFAPGWLGYYMNSHIYHDQIIPFITGIKVSSISKTAIAETIILIPPIEEQKRIIEALTQIEKLIKSEAIIIDKFKNLKSGCLKNMFPKEENETPVVRFLDYTSDWKRDKLKGVLHELYNGQTPYRQNGAYWNGDINWLSSGDLNRGIVTNTMEKITEEGMRSSNLRIIPKGTLVIAIMGLEAAGTRGNCGILGIDTTINQACMALLIDKDKVNSVFLFNWYQCFGEYYGKKIAQGTKQKNYNAELLYELDISYPSLKEQIDIGQFMSNIDEYIIIHRCKYVKYRSIKSGLISMLISMKNQTH